MCTSPVIGRVHIFVFCTLFELCKYISCAECGRILYFLSISSLTVVQSSRLFSFATDPSESQGSKPFVLEARTIQFYSMEGQGRIAVFKQHFVHILKATCNILTTGRNTRIVFFRGFNRRFSIFMGCSSKIL